MLVKQLNMNLAESPRIEDCAGTIIIGSVNEWCGCGVLKLWIKIFEEPSTQ